MKKFLPFVLFVLVFTAVLVGQVGWQTLVAETTKGSTQYLVYEDLFLKGKFEANQLSHAYLLSGPEEINKKQFATFSYFFLLLIYNKIYK
jgi:hypothetical protein